MECIKGGGNGDDDGDEEKEEEEPLDVSWPDLWYKKITYIILFPIIIPLWLTLPDVRRPVRTFDTFDSVCVTTVRVSNHCPSLI